MQKYFINRIACQAADCYKGETHASFMFAEPHYIKFPNSKFNIIQGLDMFQPRNPRYARF